MKTSTDEFLRLYFAGWGLVMPITSLLLLPIQGTTPAYVMALGSVVICAIAAQLSTSCRRKAFAYFVAAALLLMVALTLSAFGQIGLLLTRVNISELNLINPEQTRVIFRSTMITQMLYFAACVLTFAFVRYFFQPSWMKWVFAGAWLLVLYGFYDWLYYLIFKTSGDFIANRTFGVSGHTGSWGQSILVGGMRLLRLKSFTGEPAMFSLVALPYFLLALHEGRKLLSIALLVALILSTSTSAYLGLAFSAMFVTVITGKLRWQTAALMIASVILLAVLFFALPDMFTQLFTDKLSGETQSGKGRLSAMTENWEFIANANPVNLLFGLGFGYVHAIAGTGLILNTGIVGYLVFALGFLFPIVTLPNDRQAIGLRAALAGIFFYYNLSSSELFYPTSWMFLGLAYWRLDQGRKSAQTERAPHVAQEHSHRPHMAGAAVLLLLAFSGLSAHGDTLKNVRFGAATHFDQGWDTDILMPIVADSGLGWIRDAIRWRELEQEKGQYRIPEKTEKWIRAARDQGMRIILVLNYSNPIYEDPFDPEAYSKAAAWLARELDGQVQAIEILNEPENFGFREHYGGRWNGWEASKRISPWVPKYIALLNQAADAIKAANPRMTVIGLGSSPPVCFRELEMGVSSSVDGIVLHPYSRHEPEFIPYAANLRTLLRDGIATADKEGSFRSQIGMIRAQARRFKATEQLWLTEWGYSTFKPGKPHAMRFPVTAEQQAAYISRRMVESLGLDVQTSVVYDLRDDCKDPERPLCNFGLVDLQGKPKLSYFAVQRICRYFNEAAPADPQPFTTKVTTARAYKGEMRSYQFQGSDGRFLFAYWSVTRLDSPANADVSIATAGHRATLTAEVNPDLLSGAAAEQPVSRSIDGGILLEGLPFRDYPTILTIRSQDM